MTGYKIGDKLRYVGVYGRYFTNGEIYTIESIYGNIFNVLDDEGDEHGWEFENIGVEFELVDEGTPVEASPTVIELLANLSRRLYEAEQTIKEQAYEINELYKAVAER